ncbi:SRPBCC family protein [Caulobacter mirabilis]|uniref:Polyketide cyclase n=1 Tax=Caulobacter mirabilis TaxID=69666 RepID=A0A2D2ATQ2_9CAUL|nr:SRPBCC family protein [Caulobacter mirabilis]ATQ41392.1 hypothetical protein CSW64_02665 [Caulobacter mirabilis]
MIVKILIGAALLLALVAGGVALLGLTAPRDHVATGEAVIGKPPAAVAGLIRDPSGYSVWRKGVAVSDIRREGGAVFWRETSHGDAVDYRLEEEIADAGFRSTILTKGPWGGYWIITLTPEGAGTRVRITERGFVDNLIFRGLGRFAYRYDASLKAYLAALASA